MWNQTGEVITSKGRVVFQIKFEMKFSTFFGRKSVIFDFLHAVVTIPHDATTVNVDILIIAFKLGNQCSSYVDGSKVNKFVCENNSNEIEHGLCCCIAILQPKEVLQWN